MSGRVHGEWPRPERPRGRRREPARVGWRLGDSSIDVDPIGRGARHKLILSGVAQFIGPPRANATKIDHPGPYLDRIAIAERLQVFDLRLHGVPDVAHRRVALKAVSCCGRRVECRLLHVAQVVGVVDVAEGIAFVVADAETARVDQRHGLLPGAMHRNGWVEVYRAAWQTGRRSVAVPSLSCLGYSWGPGCPRE